MGLFEQFPYANFHELNLDWLLQIVKEIAGKVDSLEGDIDQAIIDAINNGEFDSIIDQILLGQKLSIYDTFADIPTSDLEEGDIVMIRGFYAKGDGGEAIYQVESGAYPSNSSYDFRVLADRVKPKQCGVFGDGFTDNTAGLSAVLAHYDKIDLDGDIYIVKTALSLRTGMDIEGSGANMTQPITSSNSFFTGNGRNNVRIANINFIGCASPGATYHAISCINADGTVIEDCTFTTGYGYVIRLSGNTNGIVRRCKFTDIDGSAGNPGGCVYMQGGSDMIFEDLKAKRIQDHVIYLDGSVAIVRCIINLCTSEDVQNPLTNAACVVCYGDVSHVTINDCACINGVVGFQVSDRNNNMPYYITFNDCYARNCSQDGFHINGENIATPSDRDIIIRGGQVVNGGQDGVGIRKAYRTIIDGLRVSGCARNGVSISESVGCSVLNCSFQNCDTAVTLGYPNDTNWCSVINCITRNSVTYGYYNRGASANNRFINSVSITGDSQQFGSAIVLVPTDYRSVRFGSAAPTSGYHAAGDIYFDSTGATSGWRCTASGVPGTWAAM